MGLLDRLEEMYREYGYCLNTLHSYEFEGAAGFEKMGRIMAAFRGGIGKIAGRQVEKTADYGPGLDGLPPADVLKFTLSGGASAVVRPSGTEPKLKVYLSVSAPDREQAQAEEKKLAEALRALMA